MVKIVNADDAFGEKKVKINLIKTILFAMPQFRQGRLAQWESTHSKFGSSTEGGLNQQYVRNFWFALKFYFPKRSTSISSKYVCYFSALLQTQAVVIISTE